MSKITELFNKYHQAYERTSPRGTEAFDDNSPELKAINLNEFRLRGKTGGTVAFSQRGGNFMDRIVCWFEDKVLARLPKALNKTRVKTNEDFINDVKTAIVTQRPKYNRRTKCFEAINIAKILEPLEGRRGSPLRVKQVRQVLQEVADVVKKEELPLTARESFGKDVDYLFGYD